MMKKYGIGMLAALILPGCATVKSMDEVRTLQAKHQEEAYKEAKDASFKTHNGKFSKVYNGKIKRIGILTTSLAWDDKGWRESDRSDFMGPGAALEDYRAVSDAVLNEIKTQLEKQGYEVLTPTQLAEASPTYKGLADLSAVQSFSPTYGQEFNGVHATGSKYIDRLPQEGKILSQIQSESKVDAFVEFGYNEVDKTATEAQYKDIQLLGSGGQGTIYFNICVSNAMAKENGAKFGLFGNPNHCGYAQVDIVAGRYLPSTRDAKSESFAESKKVGFEGMKATYTAAARGLMEALDSEFMK